MDGWPRPCTDGDSGSDRLSFLGGPLPPGFMLRVVTVPPAGLLRFDQAEWRDALVVVERGVIELECLSGGGGRFACGAVLCLSGLPLRAIHNRGREPAVLVAISRSRGER